MLLTVKDSKLVEIGTITDINVGDIVAGKPITITTTLKNTGNHHYYSVVNQVTITDAAGKIVATVNANPMPNAVIPGQSVRFDAPVSTPLSMGTYTVKSEMMLESGTVLDSRTTSVTVKEAYIPPFETTTLQVSPDKDSVLTVPGGSITITIPKGAFVEDDSVTVSPEPMPSLSFLQVALPGQRHLLLMA